MTARLWRAASRLDGVSSLGECGCGRAVVRAPLGKAEELFGLHLSKRKPATVHPTQERCLEFLKTGRNSVGLMIPTECWPHAGRGLTARSACAARAAPGVKAVENPQRLTTEPEKGSPPLRIQALLDQVPCELESPRILRVPKQSLKSKLFAGEGRTL